MVRGREIVKGTCLLKNGQPYIVVERDFFSPGKGTPTVKMKLKSIKDGSTLQMTIGTQDEVEDAQVDLRKCQYQYSDSDNCHFMDNESYDQYEVPLAESEDKKYYLKEGEDYDLSIWEGKVIDIRVPYKMVFTVAESENYIKGDTATGAT